MDDLEQMFHADFSSSDTTELWVANSTFPSYPPGLPTGYSSMYDTTVLGYQSDFDTASQSISSSPLSDCFEFHQPSFLHEHAAAHGQGHLYSEGSFDTLGAMCVGGIQPHFLTMDQPPLRTVSMSDVVIPNAPSPSAVIQQPRSNALPSLPSSAIHTSRRQLRTNHVVEDGESEVDSEGDSYCPSDTSGPPADSLSAGPLFNPPPPVRRRRRQDINLPVPVPNLTKKSRGRKVPTSSGELLYTFSKDRSKKGARTYTCHVDGCGKCFIRSEHLKRHIRSIHTNDKPWVCPVWGCERSFSRRDNLNQHMRIHKSPPSQG